MGWGTTQEGSVTQQRRLRSAEVEFVSDSSCDRKYGKIGMEIVGSDMICAAAAARTPAKVTRAARWCASTRPVPGCRSAS